MEGQIEAQKKGLFGEIIDYYQNNGICYYGKNNYIDIPINVPSDRGLYNLSQADAKEIIQFFKINLYEFIRKLEYYSHALKETLHFDLHVIFSDVCIGSEKIVGIGEKINNKLPKNLSNAIKNMFRYLIWPFIKDSYFVSRGLLKPHGFPGDYLIVEEMYNGNPKSMGLGYIYDIIFLQTQLCQGLRNRKEHMKHIITNFIAKKPNQRISLMNVGCGGSRELREIYFLNDGENISLYLMDFDPQALKYSMTNLAQKMSRAEIFPMNIDVRKIIDEDYNLNVNMCDLIYSIGLFDYLPDKILKILIRKLLELLKDDGLLVFAHKDYTFYNPRIADWFCDWKYYPRNKQDLIDLLISVNIDTQKISFSREKDGYIYFVIISK